MKSGYDVLKSMIGLHENRDTRALDAFISKYVPLWRGSHVNSTPWCAGIVNACERSIGKKGTGLLNARSFLKYGQEVRLKDAVPGDIVVFARGGSTWQGHVAYFDGLEGSLIRTIGGNQSDAVTRGWYNKSRLLGIRRS